MRIGTKREICGVLMLAIGPSLGATPQTEPPKPIVITKPLTPEQVAVYRVVLENYARGTKGTINLANKTYPLEASDRTCLKGKPDDPGNQPPAIHQLNPTQTLSPQFESVDPEHQAELIKKNDPQALIMNGIGKNNVPSPKQLDESVTRAFGTGLFTLSEILFDIRHQSAVIAYRFNCGMLCGHGNTLLLIRQGQTWKIRKTCGGWIS
jgi:hypothetical protein